MADQVKEEKEYFEAGDAVEEMNNFMIGKIITKIDEFNVINSDKTLEHGYLTFLLNEILKMIWPDTQDYEHLRDWLNKCFFSEACIFISI